MHDSIVQHYIMIVKFGKIQAITIKISIHIYHPFCISPYGVYILHITHCRELHSVLSLYVMSDGVAGFAICSSRTNKWHILNVSYYIIGHLKAISVPLDIIFFLQSCRHENDVQRLVIALNFGRLGAWRHQAISWTNVDLSSVKSCGIQPK